MRRSWWCRSRCGSRSCRGSRGGSARAAFAARRRRRARPRSRRRGSDGASGPCWSWQARSQRPWLVAPLRARDRLANGALRQHAYDITLVIGWAAQIRDGLRFGRGGRARGRERFLVRRLAAQRLLRASSADRGQADVRQPDARCRDLSAFVEPDHGGDAHDREVTDLPLELEIRPSASRRGLRYADFDQDLVRPERRGERIQEEVVDWKDALALAALRDDGGTEGKHRRGVVVRGIGVREIAADGRHVSHERIGDHGCGIRDDRITLPDDRVLLEGRLTDECADLKLSVLADARESRDAIDIYESGRLREPELH